MSEEQKSVEEVADDLIPKPPPKLAPRGITSFTVYRQQDETGVSGEGVVIEGVVMATGQCVVHWLYPPPRGGIAESRVRFRLLVCTLTQVYPHSMVWGCLVNIWTLHMKMDCLRMRLLIMDT